VLGATEGGKAALEEAKKENSRKIMKHRQQPKAAPLPEKVGWGVFAKKKKKNGELGPRKKRGIPRSV